MPDREQTDFAFGDPREDALPSLPTASRPDECPHCGERLNLTRAVLSCPECGFRLDDAAPPAKAPKPKPGTPVCANCGAEVWWSFPRPEDPCPDCGKSIGVRP